MIFLPVLIFEGGFSCDWHLFRRQFVQVKIQLFKIKLINRQKKEKTKKPIYFNKRINIFEIDFCFGFSSCGSKCNDACFFLKSYSRIRR